MVQGVIAGRLLGFRFQPTTGASRAVVSAANRALRAGLRERVTAFGTEPDEAFGLSPEAGCCGAARRWAAWRPATRWPRRGSTCCPRRCWTRPSARACAAVTAFVEAHWRRASGRSSAWIGGALRRRRGLAFSIAGSWGRWSGRAWSRCCGTSRRRTGAAWSASRVDRPAQRLPPSLLDRDAVRCGPALVGLAGAPGAPAWTAGPRRRPIRGCHGGFLGLRLRGDGPLAVRVDRLERLLAAAPGGPAGPLRPGGRCARSWAANRGAFRCAAGRRLPTTRGASSSLRPRRPLASPALGDATGAALGRSMTGGYLRRCR